MQQRQTGGPYGIQALGNFWTVPNMLTLSRLVLAVPLVYLVLARGSFYWILFLTLVAAATDWFDGRLARWSHTVSEWGKVLDPLVDKVAAGAIVVALVIRGSLPLWLPVLLIVRDGLIVAGGVKLARKYGHVSSSMFVGKVAVTAVVITVLAALLEADPPVMRFCLVFTAVFLVYSWFRYFVRFLRLLRQPLIPGIDVPLDQISDEEEIENDLETVS
jgi:CDP-diacylglycerol--glycerol-3-phosphate 3-phosphatidyltransferase